MDKAVAVIGGGPAGLIAAEILSANGVAVTVYDRMPSVGRKFLMAGRGGLNLTHSEDFERFVTRYRGAAPVLRPFLEDFTPARLIGWAEGLGQEIFKGSSGRIFPKAMKASPLLRAWLARLEAQGVKFQTRHEWCGWDKDGALLFDANGARVAVRADAVILALGGASWPKLGSDGSWSKLLEDEGVAVHPLKPANAGFNVAWSEIFRERFAGQPIKNASFRFEGETIRGEAMVTSYGIEGGAIYALSAPLRDAIAKTGNAVLHIDLRPDLSEEQLSKLLAKPRGKESLSNFLRKAVKLSPLEINLLRESAFDPAHLAKQIKDIAITLSGIAPITRAISTAGGVGFESLDQNLMLTSKPGVFVAGEMLDWEAPTGGYLLQASFATGVAAAKGALSWLK
jgi:uncharacterized flavoprotein (TIGR03862 family)